MTKYLFPIYLFIAGVIVALALINLYRLASYNLVLASYNLVLENYLLQNEVNDYVAAKLEVQND